MSSENAGPTDHRGALPTPVNSHDPGNGGGEHIFPDDSYLSQTTWHPGRGQSAQHLVAEGKLSLDLSPSSVQLSAPEKIVLDFPEHFSQRPSDLMLKLPSADIPIGLTLSNLPLSVKFDESFWERFFRRGAVVATAIATCLTVLVLWKQNTIQRVQAEASKVQADATRVQADATRVQADAAASQAELMERQSQENLRNLRAALLKEIIDGDESKRSVAVMTLAEHGEDVLLVVGQALSFEQEELRENAARVVYHLYRVGDLDSGKKPLRTKLFENLRHYLKSGNPYLLQGALTCLINLEAQLDPGEVEKLLTDLETRFAPQSFCREPNAEVMRKVAQFLGSSVTSRARRFLILIAKTASCGEARKQAVLSLATNKWSENADGLEDVRRDLEALAEQVRMEARDSRNPEDARALRELGLAIRSAIDELKAQSPRSREDQRDA